MGRFGGAGAGGVAAGGGQSRRQVAGCDVKKGGAVGCRVVAGCTPKKRSHRGHNGCDPPATLPGRGKVNGLVNGVNHKKGGNRRGHNQRRFPPAKGVNRMHTPHPLPGILGKNRNPWGQLRGQLFGARSPQIREGRTGNALKFELVTYKDAKVNGMVNTVDHKKRRR